ncbi:RNA polymerase subunit sigma-70, partial [Streptomyces sp. NPDC006386]
MRNEDGPVRDEERSTRELPAEGTGTGTGTPSGARPMADGIDGIPEQARPHPEDDSTGAVLPGGG